MKIVLLILLPISLLSIPACSRQSSQPTRPEPPHKHEHIPPHHGTPVVLGKEEHHVEFVLDGSTGKIQAYIMDGELENFVRIQQPSFILSAKPSGHDELLTFYAVANAATGETVGDTALFEARAEWLKSNSNFDAAINELQVRGDTYVNVLFNFPKGNDTDEQKK